MTLYKGDLHIHTLLSPCGDLEMSPKNIIKKAVEQNIKILGITDHNSTRQCKIIEYLAKKESIFILKGVEITTKEEVHCLAFFENYEYLTKFQEILDKNLPDIQNNVDKFGYQIVVDFDENIVYEEEKLLISALNLTINQIEHLVHSLNGIFILAHIDKTKNSIISQLGFIPVDLNVEAVEISKNTNKAEFLNKNGYLKKYSFIQNSDAHYIDELGCVFTTFEITGEISFNAIKDALCFKNGNGVIVK